MKKLILISAISLLASTSAWAQVNTAEESKPKSKWHLTYDNKYKLKFFGRISADGTFYKGTDYQKVGNGTTISQLAFGGIFSFGERIEGKFELDFSNGSITLLDNFVTYKFTNEFGLRGGNIQESFSMDLLNSFKDLSMMNRAQVVNAFAPGHHLGLQAVFENKQWLLNAGVHFQRSMNSSQKDNYESNYKKGQNEGMSYTARAVWMPQTESKDRGIHLGVAGSYRTPKTDVSKDAEPNIVRYNASESTINKIKFLDTGIINDVDYSLLAGAEIAGYYGPAKFQAEYIHNGVERKNDLKSESFSGFYVQASSLLFGGKQDYNNSRGAFNSPIVSNKGDLELVARFDRIDLNGTNIKGGSSNQYTAGFNYYLNENLKLQFNYSYITHDKYANGAGTAAIGYDAEGNLAYSPADVDLSKGKPKNNYSSFNFRFQLRF